MSKRTEQDRTQDAIRKAKQDQLAKNPINQFLNKRNEDGSIKYPMAEVLMKYYIAIPDATYNAM